MIEKEEIDKYKEIVDIISDGMIGITIEDIVDEEPPVMEEYCNKYYDKCMYKDIELIEKLKKEDEKITKIELNYDIDDIDLYNKIYQIELINKLTTKEIDQVYKYIIKDEELRTIITTNIDYLMIKYIMINDRTTTDVMKDFYNTNKLEFLDEIKQILIKAEFNTKLTSLVEDVIEDSFLITKITLLEYIRETSLDTLNDILKYYIIKSKMQLDKKYDMILLIIICKIYNNEYEEYKKIIQEGKYIKIEEDKIEEIYNIVNYNSYNSMLKFVDEYYEENF